MANNPEIQEQQCEEPPKRRADDNRLNFTLPFMNGSITGSKAVLATLIVGVSVALTYGLYMHHERTDEKLIALIDSQDATNYILTLSVEDRTKLQLDKPRRIREMERAAIYNRDYNHAR